MAKGKEKEQRPLPACCPAQSSVFLFYFHVLQEDCQPE
jgi:hypothetical protein